jgi:protein-tyrosine phosphatase
MTDGGAGPPPAHAGFDADLRIDWLAPDDLADGLPGRLGMTFLPGKRGPSDRYPGFIFRRELADDLASLRAAGVTRVVLLVEDAELVRWSEPEIVVRAVGTGVDVRRHPIPDGGTPVSLEAMDRILEEVKEGRRTGDVAVACVGGVGRSGLVVACALVQGGSTAAEAISRVRAVRHPAAVETAEQERFVQAFARRLGR